MKSEIYTLYDQLTSSYDQSLILFLYLKNIIDQTEESDLNLQNLEDDLHDLKILFSFQKERLLKLEKKIKQMFQKYELSGIELDSTEITHIFQRIHKKLEQIPQLANSELHPKTDISLNLRESIQSLQEQLPHGTKKNS